MESGKHLLNKIIATEFPAMKVSKQRKGAYQFKCLCFYKWERVSKCSQYFNEKNTTGLPELEAQLIIWLSWLTVCVFFLLEEWHKFLFHNSSGTGIREDIYSCFSIKLQYKSTSHVCQNYYH